MLTEKSRVKAVAAKISAARELARRLAEEKQAAVAAAKADADSDRLKRSTEEAAAQAAAQVIPPHVLLKCCAHIRAVSPCLYSCHRGEHQVV